MEFHEKLQELRKQKGLTQQELAAKLSKGIPQVRVDFYEVGGQVYFGEMTFFHSNGTAPVRPEKWNRILGDWIKLPEKRK